MQMNSGGNGTVLYKFNVTADASFYLFLDEDWQEALDHDNCQSKLGLARLICKSVVTSLNSPVNLIVVQITSLILRGTSP